MNYWLSAEEQVLPAPLKWQHPWGKLPESRWTGALRVLQRSFRCVLTLYLADTGLDRGFSVNSLQVTQLHMIFSALELLVILYYSLRLQVVNIRII